MFNSSCLSECQINSDDARVCHRRIILQEHQTFFIKSPDYLADGLILVDRLHAENDAAVKHGEKIGGIHRITKNVDHQVGTAVESDPCFDYLVIIMGIPEKQIEEYRITLEESYKDARKIDVDNIRRIHTLIISFAGAGLYIFFELIKFSIEEENVDISEWNMALKTGAIGFVLSIVTSFLGLVASHYGTSKNVQFLKSRINYLGQLRPGDTYEHKEEKFNVKLFNRVIRFLNYLSISLLIVSILALMVSIANII